MRYPSGAIRMGDWKLIEWFEDNKLELYNLKEDIGEQNNLQDHFPEKRDMMLEKLGQCRKDVGAKMPIPKIR